MKVKLDANLGVRGRAVLVSAGYDVATATEQSLGSASDARLIEICREEGRALVTLDTDFANPVAYPPDQYAGIVVVRTKPRTTVVDIETALLAVVHAVKGQSLVGRLVVADRDGRVREYQPEFHED